MKTHVSSTSLFATAILFCAAVGLRAQLSDIYAKHALTLKGQVDADVQLLDPAGTLAITETASLRGDARVPEDTRNNGGDGPNRRVASTVTVAVASATALKGQVREISSFELPALAGPKPATGKRNVRLQGTASEPADFVDARDITISDTAKPVAVPPGEYASLSLENAHVVFGIAGSSQPARYDFSSIDLLRGAQVDLMGPVVVTTGTLGILEGKLGRADLPGWLDLRVTARSVRVPRGGAIFGSVSAPGSSLVVEPGGVVEGWMAGADVTVEHTGRFTAHKIEWDIATHRSRHPVFAQRAVIIQNRLPGFSRLIAGHYTATTSYADDLPTLTLTELPQRNTDRREASEMAFFFEAFRVLLANSFVEEARVIMRPTPGTAEPATIDVRMTRFDFEGHLWAIGREPLAADSIRRIEESTLLQNLFLARSRKVASHAIELAR